MIVIICKIDITTMIGAIKFNHFSEIRSALVSEYYCISLVKLSNLLENTIKLPTKNVTQGQLVPLNI